MVVSDVAVVAKIEDPKFSISLCGVALVALALAFTPQATTFDLKPRPGSTAAPT